MGEYPTNRSNAAPLPIHIPLPEYYSIINQTHNHIHLAELLVQSCFVFLVIVLLAYRMLGYLMKYSQVTFTKICSTLCISNCYVNAPEDLV